MVLSRDLSRLRALGGAHEVVLLLLGLEATVTNLGRRVDPFELDLLLSVARGLSQQGLAQSDHALLGADDGTLEHDVVLVHNTIVGEATHGGDGLNRQIVLGLGVGVLSLVLTHGSLADAEDLLVHLGTMVITILTGTRARVTNAGRVPSADTGDLAQTTMRLAGQTENTPTSHHTLHTLTTGDTDAVDHIVVGEHGVDGDLFLEQVEAPDRRGQRPHVRRAHKRQPQIMTRRCDSAELHGTCFTRAEHDQQHSPLDLGLDVATVDLNLHQVSLLGAQANLADLGVSQQTDHLAVLAHAVELRLQVVLAGSQTLGVASERLSLGAIPVLVEATLQLLAQVFSPHGGQSAQTLGGLDVANQTNSNHRGTLDDGDGLDGLTFVQLRTRLVHLTQHVRHTGLVANKRSQMRRLGGVILGERANSTSMTLSALARQEAERTVTRRFVLTVRHTYNQLIRVHYQIHALERRLVQLLRANNLRSRGAYLDTFPRKATKSLGCLLRRSHRFWFSQRTASPLSTKPCNPSLDS